MLVTANPLAPCSNLVISSNVISYVMRKLTEQRKLLKLARVTVLATFRKSVVDRQLLVTVALPRLLAKEWLLAQQLEVAWPACEVWTMTNTAMVMNVKKTATPIVGSLVAVPTSGRSLGSYGLWRLGG